MKKIFVLLAKGLAIAVFAALVVCFFGWSLHSMHRLIWFLLAVTGFGFVLQFMNSDQWKYNRYGIYVGNMTYQEKIIYLLKKGSYMAFFCMVLYGSGRSVAEMFDLSPDYWEVYIVYGLIFFVFALSIVWCIIWLVITIIDNIEQKNC